MILPDPSNISDCIRGIDFYQTHLNRIRKKNASKETARSILDKVCHAHHVGYLDVIGPKRKSNQISHARQEAMWLIRKELDYSYTHIASFLSNRDHTTIIHGVRAVEARIAADPSEKKRIEGMLA